MSPQEPEIDSRGLLCPLPVLKLRKALKDAPKGHIVRLLATDPAAVIDVPHYCAESGNLLLSQESHGDATTYRVQKT